MTTAVRIIAIVAVAELLLAGAWARWAGSHKRRGARP